jgi:hypothetical protein
MPDGVDDEWGAPPEAFGLGADPKPSRKRVVRCGCDIEPEGLIHALCDRHAGNYMPSWAWSARQALDEELHEAVIAYVARSGLKFDKTHRPTGPTPTFAVARTGRTG